jgi:regulator of protease activity HflC (stomatin/prohibitin superfamily)
MAFGRYESQRPTPPTNSDTKTRKGWTPARITAAAAAGLVLVVVGFPVLFAFIGSWDNIDAGHVAVLRNGGFANQNIRGFLNPGAGMTYTGLFSTEHIYPAQQQVYTISADPAQGSTATADSIDVPSSDGVEITIDGTLYYSLNLDQRALGQFDDRYGTQTYTWNGQALHPYDGSDGWNAFINAVVRPTLQNELRTALSQVSCASVDPACALVKNSTQAAAAASGSSSSDGNLAKIQDQINSELQTDLDNQLGTVPGPDKTTEGYFQGLRFTISTVTLPGSVQTAIDTAQAAFAAVSSAQASVNAATLQAQANEITEKGYALCPACAAIAEEKALPPNITTYAPGAGVAVGAN